ncbi:MAG: type I-U CRISPR-associated protein Csx17 [bacterium]|nr:type I-U CRISPR-associated protein Csx17 [bacterium]
MPSDLLLAGCAPTPLSSYLKAIGVLRLLSGDLSHRSGIAADAGSRGRWTDERFCLTTTLDRDELVSFFCHDYVPTPIIAPWNGGSGFYPTDNKHGYEPLVANDVAARFTRLAEAISIAARVIQDCGLTTKPSAAQKTELVESLRATLPEGALDWLDAALALSSGNLSYPKLLGTGGNDGRLEFTNNFLQRLVSANRPVGLFDASTGLPTDTTQGLCRASLFGHTTRHLLAKKSPGQYSPGAAGGPNSTVGFEGDSAMNPWDYVLLLEGAVAFAGAATRRHEAGSSGGSFPFAVRTVGAGGPGVADTDAGTARDEFWAPLWSRPARYRELSALFAEGRAVLRGRTASDACDFKRSIATLGVNRGIDTFQRYGFHQRAGRTYIATPMGRHRVERVEAAELLNDLDGGNWLTRARRQAGDAEAPASLRQAIGRIENAIFDLADTAAGAKDVQRAVAAVGQLANIAARSPKQRDRIPAPPFLGQRWLHMANDGSPEFRIAAAVASIGAPPLPVPLSASGSTDDSAVPRPNGPPTILTHIAPVRIDEHTSHKPPGTPRAWLPGDSEKVVWTGRNLTRDMIALLARRLLLAEGDGDDKGLRAATPAPLWTIARFVLGPFDDAHCAALLGGLVWARPARSLGSVRHHDEERAPRAPFAYDAIKPIFTPDTALRRIGVLAPDVPLPVPPTLLRTLATATAHDTNLVNTAVYLALERARSSGLRSPFAPVRAGGRSDVGGGRHFGAGVRGDRLAAAMLIPISDVGVRGIMLSAYPDSLPEPATTPQEDPGNDS